MPWTESRTREEWLAEVRRRGERIRRRRRLTLSAVCALALLGPAFAVVSRTAGGGGARDLQVAAGGRTSAGDSTGPSVPTSFREGVAIPTTTALAGAEPLPDVTVPPGPVYSSTTTAVPRRESSLSTVPATDDPVVRATTTVPPATSGTGISGGPLSMAASASAPAGPAPARCTAGEFRLTLTLERSSYGPGQTVRGSSAIEKLSPGRCAWPAWGVEFRILTDSGKDVFETSRSRSYGRSLTPNIEAAEGGGQSVVGTGTALTNHFQWEACADPWPIVVDESQCVPFPQGTYTVVAEWTGPESGSPARATFRLGP